MKVDLLKLWVQCFCVLGLGHLAGARVLSDTRLEPPFSSTGLCIIETLASHSHANLWTQRADVKHLVLFLLTCKEIMQLFTKERAELVWERGEGEGGKEVKQNKFQKVAELSILKWHSRWENTKVYVNSSQINIRQKIQINFRLMKYLHFIMQIIFIQCKVSN